MNGDGEARLFVYGTLRDPAVQKAVFGRCPESGADVLRGYALVPVEIDGTTYRSLVPSQDAADRIDGLVLQLRRDELARADAYEGSTDYVRLAVRLESGGDAFVYVSPGR